MKRVLQVLFGLILGTVGVVVGVYLGLLLKGPPRWGSAVIFLVLIGATQWIAAWVFRRQIAVQVLSGLILCAGIAVWLLFSKLSFSWEPSYPDGSGQITWRSSAMAFLLIVITQLLSFLVFRWLKHAGRHAAA